MAIGIANGIGFGKKKSWSSYWTTQSEVLFFGEISKITDGKIYNQKSGATDYLTVGGTAGSYTFQCPNTAPYIAADTDYIWFTSAAAQRTVTTAELIGYDFPRTIIKYDDSTPYHIRAIMILKAGEVLTTAIENRMKDDFDLSIWWSNVLSFHGNIKGNRGNEKSLFILSDGNTIARYIANDLSTITKGTTNLVSKWADKLGSGRDLNQTTEGTKPVWSSSGITFLTDIMFTDAFTWNQPEFIYMVFKQITWGNGLRIFDGKTNAVMIFRQDTSSPQVECYAGSFSTNDSNLALDTFGIARILFNGASSKIQINGNDPTTGNFGGANAGGFYLGGCAAGAGANIQVKEVILRKVADVANNESAIYNFLKTRYGL